MAASGSKHLLAKIGAFVLTLFALVVVLLLIYLIYDLVMNVYVGGTPASEYFSKWTQYINIPGLEVLEQEPSLGTLSPETGAPANLPDQGLPKQ